MGVQLPPAPARKDLDLIIKWIEDTRTALESAFNFGADSIRLKKLYVEPPKPRDGDVVYVGDPDLMLGHWDPGGDEVGGYFGRHEGAWVRLG